MFFYEYHDLLRGEYLFSLFFRWARLLNMFFGVGRGMPPDPNIRICPSNLRPKISICSDHSAPSFSRSRIFHNCTMQQKKQRVNHPSTNKNGLQQNPECKKNQTDFLLRVFVRQPSGTTKRVELALVSQPQLFKTSAAEFGSQKSQVLEFQSQPSKPVAFLTTSLSPACR